MNETAAIKSRIHAHSVSVDRLITLAGCNPGAILKSITVKGLPRFLVFTPGIIAPNLPNPLSWRMVLPLPSIRARPEPGRPLVLTAFQPSGGRLFLYMGSHPPKSTHTGIGVPTDTIALIIRPDISPRWRAHHARRLAQFLKSMKRAYGWECVDN